MGFEVEMSLKGVPGKKCVNIPKAGNFTIDKVKEEIRMTVIPAFFMPVEYGKEGEHREALKDSGTNMDIVISGDAFHAGMKAIYDEAKKQFEKTTDC